ncbi:MAG: formimidoylglutamase [Pseudobdellovibrionaceae bacterium]
MFKPIDSKILPNKADPQDPRMEQLLKHKSPTAEFNLTVPKELSITVQGYPDDEGIRLNGGRPGANLGPDAIRSVFYKMTPWFHLNESKINMQDLGNLDVANLNLKQRHLAAHRSANDQISQHQFLFTLGGGHDYGFSDAAGFLDFHLKLKSPKPIVINFDAHLDVRPSHDQHHSGTPFRRLLENYSNQFHFLEVGIQPQCNSIFHLEWLTSQNGQIIHADEIDNHGMLPCLTDALKSMPAQSPLWISLDIDGFSQDQAPGCSQSWLRGFRLEDFLSSLSFLIQNYDLNGMGIYEVSPPLDVDHRTSKLAALIMYEILREKTKSLQTKTSR